MGELDCMSRTLPYSRRCSWSRRHRVQMEYKDQAAPFYRICPPPDQAPHGGDVCGTCLASAVEGPLPHRSRVIRPSSIHFGLHDRIEGDLRRHLLKQVLGIVGQGMFQLREVNQMEREMCQYLDWELNVEP
ncbi:hypothetical protein FIBSPDRAFT_1014497 [Athelia psychrophila]|uniref:Uncharacterized protein n=1 Tax=Athelia psychrophila TaxID=1759441 RepID=A0A167UBC1_9AGAM|nr:hypothetical protein FIBSPDRAFT_1014497 [Fibularhizoctonia sp. CBS 109695]